MPLRFPTNISRSFPGLIIGVWCLIAALGCNQQADLQSHAQAAEEDYPPQVASPPTESRAEPLVALSEETLGQQQAVAARQAPRPGDADNGSQQEEPRDQDRPGQHPAGHDLEDQDQLGQDQLGQDQLGEDQLGQDQLAEDEDAVVLPNPFVHRVNVPDFPRDMDWLNCGGPLRKQDLKGKFVLLDFWTYCCINCIHVLPELKKLEHAYPDQLVVVGVHSAKFTSEKDTENIEKAILRYEIEHPVVNDWQHQIWQSYGVNSWPTALLIDPEGYAVWGKKGEFTFEEVNPVLEKGIAYYRQQGLLDETPLRFDLLAHRQQRTALRFPGKVMADADSQRLFISDSNHNRLVITTLDGSLLETIGSGQIGREDGDFGQATFNKPQGVALDGEILYVADTENHLLRKVDLQSRQVTTIAGTGVQGRNPWPGAERLTALDDPPKRWVGDPKTTALNSPWALWVHDEQLYIAMAGPHQIWKMPLDQSEIGPYAGNGREDIVDGALLPGFPYQLGASSFAQPSGLTSDGRWLYVADSEGSSIRAVPFDPQQEVKTLVGTSHLPGNRLFTFGDQDGDRRQARLQHPLGVAYHDGKIYVADSYNNKIKVVDAETGQTHTLAGGGDAAEEGPAGVFDEPAGLSFARGKLYVADTNHHRIRTIELESGRVRTLEIPDLEPAAAPQQKKLTFPGAVLVQVEPARVKPEDGQVELEVELKLPEGWKINPLAPMNYLVEAEGASGPVERSALGEKSVEPPQGAFSIGLPVSREGGDLVKVSMNYYYCQEGGEGLCKVGSVIWTVRLTIADEADGSSVALGHTVPE